MTDDEKDALFGTLWTIPEHINPDQRNDIYRLVFIQLASSMWMLENVTNGCGVCFAAVDGPARVYARFSRIYVPCVRAEAPQAPVAALKPCPDIPKGYVTDLACPHCGGALAFVGSVLHGHLECTFCTDRE